MGNKMISPKQINQKAKIIFFSIIMQGDDSVLRGSKL